MYCVLPKSITNTKGRAWGTTHQTEPDYFHCKFLLSSSCIHTLAEMNHTTTPFPRDHALRSSAYSDTGHNGGNLTHVMPWLRRTISFPISHPSRPSGNSAHLLRSGSRPDESAVLGWRPQHATLRVLGTRLTPRLIDNQRPARIRTCSDYLPAWCQCLSLPLPRLQVSAVPETYAPHV
jgi:hypothetical protein